MYQDPNPQKKSAWRALPAWQRASIIVVAVIAVIVLAVMQMQKEQQQKEAMAQPTATTAAPTPTPLPHFNLTVTSTEVWKVYGKHVGEFEYFFTVRNTDTRTLKGSIEISLYNKAGDLVTTNQDPINGDLVAGKAYSHAVFTTFGPVNVAGDKGVIRFTYTVKDASGTEVSQGGADISSKYLDLKDLPS